MPTLTVNDLPIHYTERGDGPTVLALHAATSSGFDLGWLAQALVREGFNVVIPDMRGHGNTPNPAPDLHLPRLVGDVLEFIYLLGRGLLHAAGYSLGGAVALYAARRRPDLFKSLSLLGTNYRASQDDLKGAIGPLGQQSADVQRVFDPQTGVVVGWNAPLESFQVISCPVLIVCADRDEFNGPEDSLALYRTLPNADILVVPHCDHLGLVRHPLVMEALRAFYTHAPH